MGAAAQLDGIILLGGAAHAEHADLVTIFFAEQGHGPGGDGVVGGHQPRRNVLVTADLRVHLSLDGLDASENETSHTVTFENHRWYEVAVEVTTTHIKGFIDGKVVAEAATAGKDVDVRIEMLPCRPLGVASWRTVADIRNITLEERA